MCSFEKLWCCVGFSFSLFCTSLFSYVTIISFSSSNLTLEQVVCSIWAHSSVHSAGHWLQLEPSFSICISQGSQEKQNQYGMCVHVYQKVSFKTLAHTIMGLASPESVGCAHRQGSLRLKFMLQRWGRISYDGTERTKQFSKGTVSPWPGPYPAQWKCVPLCTKGYTLVCS